MAITVKKTFLWKKELDNQPGAMAEALEPLAETRRGGRGVYFKDPNGHLLELMTRT
jgi:catechol 2,3-dioxygenase-like lactoylglutathione lyase family enzyme